MKPSQLLALFADAEKAAIQAMSEIAEWGLMKENQVHSGQHYSDIVADKAILEVLTPAGLSVMSEESGFTLQDSIKTRVDENPDPTINLTIETSQLQEGEILVVIDPLDGSSNAAKSIPWYAVSLCAVDMDGPLAGYVSNMATPELPAYTAVRGEGAKYGEQSLQPSQITQKESAMVSFSKYPKDDIPSWFKSVRHMRMFGAAALEICLVASGGLDAYMDCVDGNVAPWDYLAASLICKEAGAEVVDIQNRPLLELNMATRRQILATASVELREDIRGGMGA